MSERGGIKRFEPRSPEDGGTAVVWAIDAQRLRNYLVPRDCPRVTYYAGLETNPADRKRFPGRSTAVVAIERNWYERVRSCRLFCYHMSGETFECVDECAGYYVSEQPVTPDRVDIVENAIGELFRRGVELRVMQNLSPLRDAIVASSLQFSMIRMRNALPREAA